MPLPIERQALAEDAMRAAMDALNANDSDSASQYLAVAMVALSFVTPRPGQVLLIATPDALMALDTMDIDAVDDQGFGANVPPCSECGCAGDEDHDSECSNALPPATLPVYQGVSYRTVGQRQRAALEGL